MKNLRSIFAFVFLAIFVVSLMASIYLFFEEASEKENVYKPAMVAKPARLDLGVVEAGKHEAAIRLTNVSCETVTIINSFASCTCTDISVHKGELSSGQSAEMRFFWDTKDSKGKIKGQVGILYSVPGKTSPVKSVLSVDIFAEVKDVDDADPATQH